MRADAPRSRRRYPHRGAGALARSFRLGLLAALLLPAVAYAQDRDTEAGRRAIVERIAAEIRAEHPDVATITAAALKEKLPAGNFVLVDVRTDKERAVSTLPGAITAKDFEARLDELVAEGRSAIA